MPGKSQQNQTYNQAGQQIGQTQQQEQQFLKGLGPQFTNYQSGVSGTAANAANTLQPISQGYGTFAQTGGISPETRQEIKSNLQGTLSSLYGGMQNNLNQQKAIQSGYDPGFGANQAQLSRDEANQIASAEQGTDIGLAQAIQQGQLAGLGGGLSTQQTGVGEQQAANQQQLQGITSQGQEQLASMGLTNQQIAQLLGIKSGIANRPGTFSTIMNALPSPNFSIS